MREDCFLLASLIVQFTFLLLPSHTTDYYSHTRHHHHLLVRLGVPDRKAKKLELSSEDRLEQGEL